LPDQVDLFVSLHLRHWSPLSSLIGTTFRAMARSRQNDPDAMERMRTILRHAVRIRRMA
jgi:hypothetical protein